MAELPSEARFVVVADDDAHSLSLRSGPLPRCGDDDVLVRVTAAGLNRADLLQRKGLYPPPPGASPVMGLEVSGEVVAVGRHVTRWREGDRVCALTHGGGYAEYAAVPAGQVLRIPAGMDLATAAALPEALFTVWHNIYQRGGLKAGQRLLVHGGASGIGTTAIPVAAALGATVYTTAGTPEKCAFCESLGAARAVNYRDEDFVEVLQGETGGAGIDVILDIAGGDFIEKNIAIAAPEARIVSIAFIRGFKAEINFAPVLMKRLTLTGSSLRAQDFASKAVMAREIDETVLPLYDAGRVTPVIDSVWPLAEVEAAQARMTSGEHTGKILLSMS